MIQQSRTMDKGSLQQFECSSNSTFPSLHENVTANHLDADDKLPWESLTKNDITISYTPERSEGSWTLRDEMGYQLNFKCPSNLDVTSRLRAGQEIVIDKIKPIPSGKGDNDKSDLSKILVVDENGYVKIDYKLVRRCLIYGSAKEKCEVLNAIRSRITSSETPNIALDTIHDIVHYDLFDLHCVWKEDSLLEDLLWPMNVSNPHSLQLSISRLLNVVVSYQIGREYFDNKSIVEVLIWDEPERRNIRQDVTENLIATMMKLSFIPFQSADMVKQGVLMWVVHQMAEAEYSTSKYHLEYLTGLLRMLLNVENCIDFTLIDVRHLMLLLANYLANGNQIVKRNVFACILTLFTKPKILDIAKEINFERVVGEYIQAAAGMPPLKLPKSYTVGSQKNQQLALAGNASMQPQGTAHLTRSQRANTSGDPKLFEKDEKEIKVSFEEQSKIQNKSAGIKTSHQVDHLPGFQKPSVEDSKFSSKVGPVDEHGQKGIKERNPEGDSKLTEQNHLRAVYELLCQSNVTVNPLDYSRLDTRLNENDLCFDSKDIEADCEFGEQLIKAKFSQRLYDKAITSHIPEYNIDQNGSFFTRIFIDATIPFPKIKGNRIFETMNKCYVNRNERTCISFYEEGSMKSGHHHQIESRNTSTTSLPSCYGCKKDLLNKELTKQTGGAYVVDNNQSVNGKKIFETKGQGYNNKPQQNRFLQNPTLCVGKSTQLQESQSLQLPSSPSMPLQESKSMNQLQRPISTDLQERQNQLQTQENEMTEEISDMIPKTSKQPDIHSDQNLDKSSNNKTNPQLPSNGNIQGSQSLQNTMKESDKLDVQLQSSQSLDPSMINSGNEHDVSKQKDVKHSAFSSKDVHLPGSQSASMPKKNKENEMTEETSDMLHKTSKQSDIHTDMQSQDKSSNNKTNPQLPSKGNIQGSQSLYNTTKESGELDVQLQSSQSLDPSKINSGNEHDVSKQKDVKHSAFSSKDVHLPGSQSASMSKKNELQTQKNELIEETFEMLPKTNKQSDIHSNIQNQEKSSNNETNPQLSSNGNIQGSQSLQNTMKKLNEVDVQLQGSQSLDPSMINTGNEHNVSKKKDVRHTTHITKKELCRLAPRSTEDNQLHESQYVQLRDNLSQLPNQETQITVNEYEETSVLQLTKSDVKSDKFDEQNPGVKLQDSRSYDLQGVQPVQLQESKSLQLSKDMGRNADVNIKNQDKCSNNETNPQLSSNGNIQGSQSLQNTMKESEKLDVQLQNSQSLDPSMINSGNEHDVFKQKDVKHSAFSSKDVHLPGSQSASMPKKNKLQAQENEMTEETSDMLHKTSKQSDIHTDMQSQDKSSNKKTNPQLPSKGNIQGSQSLYNATKESGELDVQLQSSQSLDPSMINSGNEHDVSKQKDVKQSAFSLKDVHLPGSQGASMSKKNKLQAQENEMKEETSEMLHKTSKQSDIHTDMQNQDKNSNNETNPQLPSNGNIQGSQSLHNKMKELGELDMQLKGSQSLDPLMIHSGNGHDKGSYDLQAVQPVQLQETKSLQLSKHKGRNAEVNINDNQLISFKEKINSNLSTETQGSVTSDRLAKHLNETKDGLQLLESMRRSKGNLDCLDKKQNKCGELDNVSDDTVVSQIKKDLKKSSEMDKGDKGSKDRNELLFIKQLLSNEEVMDLLCEKLLKKIAARNDFCGPNCGSKCGGLNTPRKPT